MVTIDPTYVHPHLLYGKSTDTKPTETFGAVTLENGDKFLEFDTGEVYFFDGDVTPPGDPWVKPD